MGDLATTRAGLPQDPRSFPTLSVLQADWIARREHTHRSWADDRGRWKNHLQARFGQLRASDVDHGRIRAFVEEMRRTGHGPESVRLCIACLSTMYSDPCERPQETGVSVNPVRGLPRSTRRLFRSTHDPKLTPFIERMADVARVYRALAQPFNVAYSLGAFGGLRTGEVLAVDWEYIDLDAQRMVIRWQVRDGKLGPLKDDEPRTITIRDTLVPILRSYKLATGGKGLLFRPENEGRRSGPSRRPATFMRPQTLYARLREALKKCGLSEDMTWYQVTRHTFASQWVLGGGSIEKLAVILGHSATWVTERYAHLRIDQFAAEDAKMLYVDLNREGSVVQMKKNGQRMGSAQKMPTRRRARKVLSSSV